VLNFLTTFDGLQLVQVDLEVLDATRLSKLSKSSLHLAEKFFFFHEVLLLFLFDFDFDHGLELAHKLFS